jgi:hypothetical protein
VNWQNRAHFFATSAQLMRRILVDAARERISKKRGGGAENIVLDEALIGPPGQARDLVALDDALKVMAEVDPRKTQVVKLRFLWRHECRRDCEMTITNTGAGQFNVTGISISRDNPSEFRIGSGGVCGPTLNHGDTCAVDIIHASPLGGSGQPRCSSFLDLVATRFPLQKKAQWCEPAYLKANLHDTEC